MTPAFWIILIGALAAGSCALVGSFLVLRRMAMLGDAISHAVLPGIAIAFLLSNSRAAAADADRRGLARARHGDRCGVAASRWTAPAGRLDRRDVHRAVRRRRDPDLRVRGKVDSTRSACSTVRSRTRRGTRGSTAAGQSLGPRAAWILGATFAVQSRVDRAGVQGAQAVRVRPRARRGARHPRAAVPLSAHGR